ncbi:class I SAM-dependent methyltransferase [Desulfobacterota bacterium M19]
MSIVRNTRAMRFELIRKVHLLWYVFAHNYMLRNKKTIMFQCNICGANNVGYPIDVYDREKPSCLKCGSNMRARTIVDLLTTRLYGDDQILAEIQNKRHIRGLGISDWPGYADLLSKKFNYQNSFFHKEPKLDITNLNFNEFEKYDFIISSEVFEHISPPVSTGFKNLYRLLKSDGFCLITVPFVNFGKTMEYYPSLYKYKIIYDNGQACLLNTTKAGKKQRFHNLNFHGGGGSTLELRCYTRASLYDELIFAGFRNIVFHREKKIKFGINWTVNWSVPISAAAHS